MDLTSKFPKVRGVIFDKDGTLFDFQATWAAWVGQMIRSMLPNDLARQAELAEALGFDLPAQKFLVGSVVIAETLQRVAEVIHDVVPDRSIDQIIEDIHGSAGDVPQIEATPLVPFFEKLKSNSLKIGVVTNDSEAIARVHLDRAGVLPYLDFLAGYDSGFGMKPDASPLIAAADAMGLSPEDCVMVGDSQFDLRAARAAAMPNIAVLTGVAPSDELAPFADVILPSIAEMFED